MSNIQSEPEPESPAPDFTIKSRVTMTRDLNLMLGLTLESIKIINSAITGVLFLLTDNSAILLVPAVQVLPDAMALGVGSAHSYQTRLPESWHSGGDWQSMEEVNPGWSVLIGQPFSAYEFGNPGDPGSDPDAGAIRLSFGPLFMAQISPSGASLLRRETPMPEPRVV